MIVASFFAPRFDKWEGCDYLDCLRLLQASCDKLGLKHVVISDRQQAELETFITPLPDNIMHALILGQREFIASLKGPALLVGADCLMTRRPEGVIDGCDAGFTIYPRRECFINNGAVWVTGPHCATIWDEALKRKPRAWGDDQKTLRDSLLPVPNKIKAPVDHERLGLKIRFVPCTGYNWFPDSLDDDAGMAMVIHFKGERKKLMRGWAKKYLGIE
jgi:hypothetical protein